MTRVGASGLTSKVADALSPKTCGGAMQSQDLGAGILGSASELLCDFGQIISSLRPSFPNGMRSFLKSPLPSDCDSRTLCLFLL